MVALLPELAKVSGFRLRVILIQRAIQRYCLVERDGIEYEGIPYRFPERFNSLTLHLAKSIQAYCALKRFQPDIVHAFGMETGSATIALHSGFPVSCFIQGISERYGPYSPHRSIRDLAAERFCEARAVKQIRWFVAETEFARRWVNQRNQSAYVSLIPHPLRADFLQKSAPTFQKQIIAVGALNERKGMDTVIKAFAHAKVSDGRLCLVGSGPKEIALRELAGALGINDRVEFAGSLATDHVIARMNESSALAIGSRVDTSPNVVSEAHGIGLPVIGTRAGGIPEMIDEGRDGCLVAVDDDQAMGLCMNKLLSDPEACRRMGKAGQEKVRFLNSPERIAQAHVEFFRKIQQDLGRLQ